MGNTPIRAWQLTIIANQLEYRGNDATGVALMYMDGRTAFCKNNDPAWKFTASKYYKEWIAAENLDEVRIALVHTRKATKGSPYKNDNNHPICSEPREGIIVHNGMISNDDALFTENKGKPGWKRACETDSDAIRAILDNHGGIDTDLIKHMNSLSGMAAVAAIHPATPDKLLLLRDSNPLILGATKDMLAFASDKKALYSAMKPWVRMHGIVMQVHAPDLSFLPMPNETGWVIGPQGYESRGEFKANGFRRNATRYFPSTDYHERQERFKKSSAATGAADEHGVTRVTPGEPSGAAPTCGTHRKAFPNYPVKVLNPEVLPADAGLPRYVICPNSKCSKHLDLSAEQQKVSMLAMLACASCDTNLSGAVRAEMVN